MLWVLERTVSMRRFFWGPKTYAKHYELENIYNFTLKFFAYLNMCTLLRVMCLIAVSDNRFEQQKSTYDAYFRHNSG